MIVVEGKGLDLLNPKEMPMKVLVWLSVGFIVAGGAIPYVFQYLEIKKRRSASGFSLAVCLTLCIANILRLFFWAGEDIGLDMFSQSFVMLVCMVVMLELSVRMNRKETPPARRTSILKGHFFSAFWGWSDLKSYCALLVGFVLLAALPTVIFLQNHFYMQSLGFLALGTEAMLGVPQLYRNFKRASTEGMSIGMVLAWFVGDAFKTAYYFYKGKPWQFPSCAIFQVTVDVLILGQVLYYDVLRRGRDYLPEHNARL